MDRASPVSASSISASGSRISRTRRSRTCPSSAEAWAGAARIRSRPRSRPGPLRGRLRINHFAMTLASTMSIILGRADGGSGSCVSSKRCPSAGGQAAARILSACARRSADDRISPRSMASLATSSGDRPVSDARSISMVISIPPVSCRVRSPTAPSGSARSEGTMACQGSAAAKEVPRDAVRIGLRSATGSSGSRG